MYFTKSTISVCLAFLASKAVSLPTSSTKRDEYPYPQVNFTGPFPSTLSPGAGLELEWFGGSGCYDLYTYVRYPGLNDYHVSACALESRPVAPLLRPNPIHCV